MTLIRNKVGFRNFPGFRNSFVGFRICFVGFGNYFGRIQKLFSLDSPTLPGGGGWGGVGCDDNVPWPLALLHMVDATQDLG